VITEGVGREADVAAHLIEPLAGDELVGVVLHDARDLAALVPGEAVARLTIAQIGDVTQRQLEHRRPHVVAGVGVLEVAADRVALAIHQALQSPRPVGLP